MSIEFLKRLLSAPGPSGREHLPSRVWREEAGAFADQVTVDVRGSSLAILKGDDRLRVLLAGHIDEIGLIVTYIDDDGFLSFAGVGGWDVQVLVGQRIRLLGRAGDVIGVIGRKPIHLMQPGETAPKLEDLWIDIGARNRAEAAERVSVGTFGVIDAPFYELPNQRIVSRSIDNRIGAYTVLEVLRRLAAERPAVTAAAAATAQEEITFAGANTVAFAYEPHAAIVVDVTHATDYPTADKKLRGEARLGSGPAIACGSVNSPVVHDMLVEVARQNNIPYTVKVNPAASGTDGDAIHLSRAGVAVGVVSIPNRYMHSPNEMIQLDDVENAIQLIVGFVKGLTPETRFEPV